MAHDKCKSLGIFRSTLDFGIGHMQTCFSFSNIKENVKKRLIKIPILYKPTVELYKKYYLHSQKYYQTLMYYKTSDELKFDNTDRNLSEIPFIEGLINSKAIKKNDYVSSDNDYEYNNWYRSHGGNWNTKFNSKKNINKTNINNLKLAWKYSSINKENLKKKWKGNIELNPIFINNKIIAVTADWKIIAINAANGNLIWELQSDFMPSRRGILVENDVKLNLENQMY